MIDKILYFFFGGLAGYLFGVTALAYDIARILS